MPVQKGSKPGPCKGKKFLVTGGARGIGRAVVEELHIQGATVYAVSRSKDSLKALEAELPGVKTIAVDLSDWNATRKALENLEPMDGLINCAGIADIPGRFYEMTPEKLDNVFNVDFKAVVNVSQVISKKMVERGVGGTIVNILAVDLMRVVPAVLGYSCVKIGVGMLTKGMALELAPHKITVNGVAPACVDGGGMTRDGLDSSNKVVKKEMEELVEEFKIRTPTGNPLIPMKQIVSSVMFFASGENTQVTGEVLTVDGGFKISF